MPLTYDSALKLLQKHSQAHVLGFWKTLDESQRAGLLGQIETLDFDSIARMQKMLENVKSVTAARSDMAPAAVIRLDGAAKREAARAGGEAISRDRAGVLLVAGGQGSRLGFDGPKGVFPIGPITGAPLFEIHSRKILALEKKFKAKIPFYIMTSRGNDRATKDFFEKNRYFGLTAERVRFFTQGMWPALTSECKIILDAPGSIFMSPDGHGGILAALKNSGTLDDMKKRGLTTLFYFQVDNPLVEIADPAFIGAHVGAGADMSVKVCAKRDPDEGLGVVVVRGGRNEVVEYTELTKEQKHARTPDGQLLFNYGSVAIHVFSLDFLVREAAAALPLHLAHKKVPYCGGDGKVVKPDAPNAYKFEKFIFDVLPDAERALNVVFAREDEFSPVKNPSGADSPDMTKRDMVRKFARWMEACGIAVPRGVDGESAHRIEIDPCFALSAEDLKMKLPAGFALKADTHLK